MTAFSPSGNFSVSVPLSEVPLDELSTPVTDLVISVTSGTIEIQWIDLKTLAVVNSEREKIYVLATRPVSFYGDSFCFSPP